MTFQTVRKARTSSKGRSDRAFQECAEAWMPEPKRHMDVLERFLESPVRLAQAPKLKKEG